MNKFLDTIKHAIVEDDPDPKSSTPNQSPAAQTPNSVALAHESTSAASPVGGSYAALGEETEHVYKRILAKTDFLATPIATTIHKNLDPLSAIPAMDNR